MRQRVLRLLLFFYFLTFAFPAWPGASAQAAKRLALVVGINAYDNLSPAGQLKTAVNDARAVAKGLKAVGFDIIKEEDPDRRRFNIVWQTFLNRMEPGDEIVMFFSGHGVEIGGLNYLLPRDIPKLKPGEEELLKREAVGLAMLLTDLKGRQPRLSVLVLDACRDNPFGSAADAAGTRSLGSARGLAQIAPPEGTFIMYSAGAGQTALDRLSLKDQNPNSVYTRQLLPLIGQRGLPVPQLARRVRQDVQQLAVTVGHRQTPAYYDEITGSFCLAGCGVDDMPGAVKRKRPLVRDAYKPPQAATTDQARSGLEPRPAGAGVTTGSLKPPLQVPVSIQPAPQPTGQAGAVPAMVPGQLRPDRAREANFPERPYKKGTIETYEQCAQMCVIENPCAAISYDQATRLCRLFD